MQDNNEPRTINDIIAGEPDLLRRCSLINFNMDALQSPEDALLSHNVPAEIYAQWAEKHFENLVSLAAQATGADPEQIADKERRTPEQQKALLEASAREQLARLDIVLNSNYRAAIKHIKEYCIAVADAGGEDIYKPLRDEAQPEALQSGQLVNAPLAAVLYFFATHEDIDPRARDSLTAADKGTIIENFNSIDAFYKEYRAELHTEQELLRGFIESINPNPARAQEAQNAVAIISQRLDALDFPVDKVNAHVWRLLEQSSGAGQIGIHTEKSGNKTEVLVYYSISFDEESLKKSGIEITKKLDRYDKRVCIAAAALFNSGQPIFSFTTLYHAIGYTGRPNAAALKKMSDSIKKMRIAQIFLTNSGEHSEIEAAYKYPAFKYSGAAMPSEDVQAISTNNGAIIEGAIHVLREPPLIQFARERKQFTRIQLVLLQAPVNKTERVLAMEDYLIERISRMKNEHNNLKTALYKLQRKKNRTEADQQKIDSMKDELKRPGRIMFDTLFANADITEKKQRQRAKNTAEKLLNHYKNCNLFTAYAFENDGVSITFE